MNEGPSEAQSRERWQRKVQEAQPGVDQKAASINKAPYNRYVEAYNHIICIYKCVSVYIVESSRLNLNNHKLHFLINPKCQLAPLRTAFQAGPMRTAAGTLPTSPAC